MFWRALLEERGEEGQGGGRVGAGVTGFIAAYVSITTILASWKLYSARSLYSNQYKSFFPLLALFSYCLPQQLKLQRNI